MQSTEARAALERLTAEQYEDPPPHRVAVLDRLIQQARVTVAETELEAVDQELQKLEAGEAERQEALSRTATELARARNEYDRAQAVDSAARQRIAAIRSGIKPHRESTLEQLTNTGQ